MTVYGVPGVWTGSSVAPAIARDWTIVVPVGVWTALAASPGITSGSSNTVSVPAAVFTGGSVAPIVSISSTIVVTPPVVALVVSGSEITDATRALNVQGDARPAESSFGIWESILNRVPNGGFETGLGSGWAKYNLSGAVNPIALGTDGGVFGSNYLKCTCDTVGNFGAKLVDFYTGSPASQGPYTWSCWARAGNAQTVGKTITLQINEQGGATGDQPVASKSVTLTSAWQRFTGFGTFAQTDRTHVSLFFYTAGSAGQAGSAIGDEVHFDGVQVELAAAWSFPTPYIETKNAGVTRPAATPRVPTLPLDPVQGWLAIRFRVGWPSTMSGKFPTPFIAYNSTIPLQQLRLAWSSTGITWQLLRWAGVNTGGISVGQSFAAGDLITIVTAWDAAKTYMSINGAVLSNSPSATIPSGIDTYCIGWDGSNNGRQIDSDIFWFACGKGVISNADAAALNALGNTDPTWVQLPSQPILLWTADTANAALLPALLFNPVAPIPSITVPNITSGFCANGDFETDTSGWDVVAYPGVSGTRDTTSAAVGTASLKTVTDGTGSQGSIYNGSPTLPSPNPAGTRYRVSFWIKANTPADVGRQVRFDFRHYLATVLQQSLPLVTYTLPAAWTYMTVETTTQFSHDQIQMVWRTPTNVATSWNLDGVICNIVQLAMTPANPSLLVAVPPVPAPVTYSSTSPTLFIGTSNTVVAPAARVTNGAVAPILGITATPPAGNFTTASNAPGLGMTVQPNAVLANLSSVAPIIGIGTTVISPAARITLSSTATIAFSTDVEAPAASWLFSTLSPGLEMRLVASAAAVGYSSVAPECGTFAYIYAPPGRINLSAPTSAVIIEGSGMVYTYTPGAVWQAPAGDVAAPKTGRIVQSYERP